MKKIEEDQFESKMMYDVRFIAERKDFFNIKEEVEIQKILIFSTKLTREHIIWIVHTRFLNVKSVSYINNMGKALFMEK